MFFIRRNNKGRAWCVQTFTALWQEVTVQGGRALRKGGWDLELGEVRRGNRGLGSAFFRFSSARAQSQQGSSA